MNSVTSNAVYNVLNKKEYNTVLDQSINARSYEKTINQSGFYNISVRVYTTDDNDRLIYIALDSQTIARMKITGTMLSQHLNTSTFIKAGTKLRFVSNDSSNVMIVDAYVCRVVKCEII